jgi:hypothetical protein
MCARGQHLAAATHLPPERRPTPPTPLRSPQGLCQDMQPWMCEAQYLQAYKLNWLNSRAVADRAPSYFKGYYPSYTALPQGQPVAFTGRRLPVGAVTPGHAASAAAVRDMQCCAHSICNRLPWAMYALRYTAVCWAMQSLA